MAVAPPTTLVDEITDFLITRPTPEEIIAFKTPETINQRLHDLLDKNRNEGLTLDEREELNHFLLVGHLLTILKAKARLQLERNAYDTYRTTDPRRPRYGLSAKIKLRRTAGRT